MRPLRALCGLLLLAGCGRSRTTGPVAPAPDPAPASAPAPAPAPVSTPAAELQPDWCSHHHGCIQVCVLRSGQLESLPVYINVVTGDSTYRGQRFSLAFPVDSAYAGAARWYLDAEPIVVAGRRYVKYGVPRVLGPTDVEPAATFRGVTVFAEAGTDLRRPEVIYLPTRPSCEFQPYMRGGRK